MGDNLNSSDEFDTVHPSATNNRYQNLPLVYDPTAPIDPHSDNNHHTDTAPPLHHTVPTLETSAQILQFIHSPAPRSRIWHCKIIRQRTGVEKLYPAYQLFLDTQHHPTTSSTTSSQVLLMSARKRKKTTHANYVIMVGSTGKSKDNVVAQLRSNFIGTEFTVSTDAAHVLYFQTINHDGMLMAGLSVGRADARVGRRSVRNQYPRIQRT